MSSGDKEQVTSGDSSNSGGNRSVLVMLVVIALVVGTIAVILGIVALSSRIINDVDVIGGEHDGDYHDEDRIPHFLKTCKFSTIWNYDSTSGIFPIFGDL